MPFTFGNDSDVIVYTLEKIIFFARENQYLFVANCAWWIAGVIGLDRGLTIYIDNICARIELTSPINNTRGVSTIPRDIASNISPESAVNATTEDQKQLSRQAPKRKARKLQSSWKAEPTGIRKEYSKNNQK
jgi:hypothetical protein